MIAPSQASSVCRNCAKLAALVLREDTGCNAKERQEEHTRARSSFLALLLCADSKEAGTAQREHTGVANAVHYGQTRALHYSQSSGGRLKGVYQLEVPRISQEGTNKGGGRERERLIIHRVAEATSCLLEVHTRPQEMGS
jgi:hypothetical protein